MDEMWKLSKDYVLLVFGRKWFVVSLPPILTTVAQDIVLVLQTPPQDIRLAQYFEPPPVLFWSSVFLGASIAQFLIWKDERVARKALDYRMKGFPLICPAKVPLRVSTVSVGIAVRSASGQSLIDPRDLLALYLCVRNEPKVPSSEATGKTITATVTFQDEDGRELFSMAGRWADSPQPFQRDMSRDIVEIVAVDFAIGQERALDIVLKHPEDVECYASNNDNAGYERLRKPEHRLPQGNFLCKVLILGPNVNSLIMFRFANDGAGAGLRFGEYWYQNQLETEPGADVFRPDRS